MSIRVVLVPVFGAESDRSSLDAACGLAQRLEARVATLFVRIEPADIIPFVGEGVSPAVIEQLMKSAEDEMSREAGLADRAFVAACEGSGLPVVNADDRETRPAAHWSERVGRREDVITAAATLADLTVFAIHADSDDHMSVVEATLLGSGRPVLMVPPGWDHPVGERIAVAWNSRREAALALGASLELLERASAVDLLTAETASSRFESSAAVADYLMLHGIACQRHATTPADQGVGGALLKKATEVGADLLVMGGYGRSRLSELVLGGVTRHVLAHATVPVLMAH